MTHLSRAVKFRQAQAGVAFYLGILISSIGSGTFFNSLMAFLLASGEDLSTASKVLGFSRILPVLVNFLLGDLADHVSARKMIIGTEVVGALCSLGLLMSWRDGPSIVGVTVFATGHAIALGMQGAAKAKLSKALSASDYRSNAAHAILLNVATYGTTAIAGFLGWVAVSYLSFEWVVAFDAFTFVVNGALLLFLPIEAPSMAASMTLNVLQKFKNLLETNRTAVVYDVLLALVMAGTNVFIARITSPHGNLIPVFIAAFGLSVWVAGWLERKEPIHKRHSSVWLVLGISYLVLGMTEGWPWVAILVLSMIKDTSYWVLFHRYSAKIRHASDVRLMSSIFAAKSAATILILCLGEIAVGAMAAWLPLSVETAFRSAICVAIALVAMTRGWRLE